MQILGVKISIPTSTKTPQFNPSNSYPQNKSEIEIRVCVNRTCRRQGSRETLELLTDLTPPHISINSSGCLGKCGAGPNLVVLPQALVVSHCGTASKASQVLSSLIGGDGGDSEKNLSALALRKRAEEELKKGGFAEAETLLSKAIDLKPSGGLHITYKSRSTVRFAMGNNLGALEDSNEALTVAPQYPQGFICQGDAFFALGEFAEAEKSYLSALEIDSSIRRSKSFKSRVKKLNEKLSAANMPP